MRVLVFLVHRFLVFALVWPALACHVDTVNHADAVLKQDVQVDLNLMCYLWESASREARQSPTAKARA